MESTLQELLARTKERRDKLESAIEEKKEKEIPVAPPMDKPATPTGFARVGAAIATLFGNEDMTDVVFIVSGAEPKEDKKDEKKEEAKKEEKKEEAKKEEKKDEKKEEATVVEFPAHKCICASGSPVFKKLIYGDDGKGLPDEKKDKKGRTQVAIRDVPASIFKLLLQGLYTGGVDVTLENMNVVLKHAVALAVPAATEACEVFLDDALTMETAWDMYCRAPSLGIDPKWGVEFICNHFQTLSRLPQFLRLPKERLARLLPEDTLVCPLGGEIELFKLVMTWGEAELKRRHEEKKDEPKDGELKELLGDLMPHIRFPLIPMEPLSAVVAPTGLLPMEQLLLCFSYTALDATARKAMTMPFSTRPRPTRPRLLAKRSTGGGGGGGGKTEEKKGKEPKGTGAYWPCPTCTFNNSMKKSTCEMCESPRPSV